MTITTISELNQQSNAIKNIRKDFKNNLELNMFEIIVLKLVYDNKVMDMREIQNQTQLIQPEVNKAVQKIKTKDFLTKKRNLEDERTVTVYLTEDKEKLKEIKKILKQANKIIENNQ